MEILDLFESLEKIDDLDVRCELRSFFFRLKLYMCLSLAKFGHLNVILLFRRLLVLMFQMYDCVYLAICLDCSVEGQLFVVPPFFSFLLRPNILFLDQYLAMNEEQTIRVNLMDYT